MSKPLTFGKSDVFLSSTLDGTSGTIDPNTPFRILILGDWSGKGSRAVQKSSNEIGRMQPIFVDRDNFEAVLGKMGVEVALRSTNPQVAGATVKFAELDEFHPDGIYKQVGLFATLRNLRSALGNTRTFEAAAATVRSWSDDAGKRPNATPEPETQPKAIGEVTGASLLEQMLAGGQGQVPVASSPTKGEDASWDNFLQDLVKPYIQPGNDSELPELVDVVDKTTSVLMRSILHDANFQELEAAWRALYFLVRGLDTGTELKLYLLDVSKSELTADLNSTEDLTESGIYKLLVEQTVGTPGAEPWAVLCGNYSFGNDDNDIETLGRIAKIARQAGAPFLASVNPEVFGCDSPMDLADCRETTDESNVNDNFRLLRGLPEATYLGLAAPRFLLRLPYGKDTDEIERFAFEEFEGTMEHEAYLWGNPAFICTYLLAQSFSEHGWEFRPGANLQVEGLPLHAFEQDGSFETKPCAEVLLSERAADAIMSKGVMPLLSLKGADTIRLARFQSIAEPASALNGPWV
jgi:type VI secretion system protein ImpC